MTSHLLCLSDLEAAAPGILKVIFGADGDFKNAPPFAGPVSVIKALPDLMAGGYLWIHGGLTPDGIWDGAGRLTPFDAVALDCRVPGVAARLAGLCARASSRFSTPNPAKAWIYYTGDGMIQLMAEDRALYGLEHDPFWTDDGNIDYGAFVRVVVLDLAPKIAALNIP